MFVMSTWCWWSRLNFSFDEGATTCYMLRHATTCYDMLRHATTCYDMLRHATTCYDMLRHATTCYDMLRHACQLDPCFRRSHAMQWLFAISGRLEDTKRSLFLKFPNVSNALFGGFRFRACFLVVSPFDIIVKSFVVLGACDRRRRRWTFTNRSLALTRRSDEVKQRWKNSHSLPERLTATTLGKRSKRCFGRCWP